MFYSDDDTKMSEVYNELQYMKERRAFLIESKFETVTYTEDDQRQIEEIDNKINELEAEYEECLHEMREESYKLEGIDHDTFF